MSKYDRLYAYLVNSSEVSIKLTFQEVENLVGGLPDSASNHRAWWSNDGSGSHVQAHAWMGAGYKVTEVEMGSWTQLEKI